MNWDCFPRLEEIPEVAVWHTHPGSDGQYHSNALHEQGLRDQVQQPGLEGPRGYSVVSDVENCSDCSPYFGPQKHCGGLPLMSSSRESSPFGKLHGMVSGSQDDWPHPDDWWLDLFTLQLKNKVEALYCRLPDPLTLPGNSRSLQADWSKGLLYTYPPLPFLSLALHKMIQQQAHIIAILPWWPWRGRFPLILQFLVNLPMLAMVNGHLLVSCSAPFTYHVIGWPIGIWPIWIIQPRVFLSQLVLLHMILLWIFRQFGQVRYLQWLPHSCIASQQTPGSELLASVDPPRLSYQQPLASTFSSIQETSVGSQ